MESKPPCRCRTGSYCHRHLSYGLSITLKSLDKVPLDTRQIASSDAPAGGGYRRVRKGIDRRE